MCGITMTGDEQAAAQALTAALDAINRAVLLCEAAGCSGQVVTQNLEDAHDAILEAQAAVEGRS